jgi:D-alanyl-D-alanine carboxypeptidase (penicillin-binding protein 5/6)
MKIPFFQKLSIWILFLSILLILTPAETFSKPSKPSKPKSSLSIHPIKKKPITQEKESPGQQGVLQCNARSALLMDALTGEILFEQNPNEKIPPASFVKILTLYLVFDAMKGGQLKMDELVTVSEKAWRTQGSKMFIEVGARVKVEDLIKGVAVASGNDACIALAEHLAGSEEVFVSKMNEKARLIGMKDSYFRNSHGLPAEGQVTTAMDMAILAKRYIEDHPEALTFHSTTEFEYNGIRQGNRNTLLQKNIGVDGLKTGHIEESGYHLLATARRDGQRMIAVIMGCDRVSQRAQEAQKLLEYGFKNFSTLVAIKKDQPFGPIKVRRGKIKQLTLLPQEEGRVTVMKGRENSITIVPELPSYVVAPVQKGQILGKALIQKDGREVKRINLLASSDIEKSLLFSWPILGAIGGGAILILVVGFWWFRRTRRRKV